MARWLIYALGGGLGHAVRAACIARELSGCGVRARVLCAEHAASAARRLFPDVSGLTREEHPTPRALADRLALELASCDLLLLDTFPRGVLGELDSVAPAVPRILLTRLVREPHPALNTRSGWAELGLQGVVDIEPNLEWLRGPAVRCGPVARRLTQVHLSPKPVVQVALPDEAARKRVVELLERAGISCVVAEGGELAEGFCAPIVIGRAGYNLTYELVAAGIWHVALPAARPIDDQARRAEYLGARVLSPQALERRLRGLVGAGPRPPSVVLEHRELAARLIEFARGLG
ncbi:MAG: hypothetical protein R3B07_09850 [Polyangiaceae bacterium]